MSKSLLGFVGLDLLGGLIRYTAQFCTYVMFKLFKGFCLRRLERALKHDRTGRSRMSGPPIGSSRLSHAFPFLQGCLDRYRRHDV